MKNILYLFIVIILSSSSTMLAQDSLRTNTFYAELGGNCFWYSINYENQFENNFSARIGFGNGSTSSDSYIAISLMVNYFLQIDGNNKCEFGAGTLLAGEMGLTTSIGYRYSPDEGGIMFKLTLVPILISSDFYLWGGIGLGFTF